MSKWLNKARENIARLKEQKEQREAERRAAEHDVSKPQAGDGPTTSGFLCALCANLDLGSLDALQAHYLERHSSDDDANDVNGTASVETNANLSQATPPVQEYKGTTEAIPLAQSQRDDSDRMAHISGDSETAHLRMKVKEEQEYSACLTKELQSLKEEHAKFASEKQAAEQTSADMIADLLGKIETMESSSKDDAMLTTLEVKITELESVLTLEKESHKVTSDNAEESANLALAYQQEVDDVKLRCASLEAQVTTSQNEVERLKTELDSRPYPEEVTVLTAEIEALKQTSTSPDSASEQAATDSAALNRVVEEMSTLRRRLEDAETNLTGKTNEVHSATRRAMEAEKSRDVLLHENRNLVAELAEKSKSLGDALAALETEKVGRSGELAQLASAQIQLSEEKTASTLHQSRISDLDRQLKVKETEIRTAEKNATLAESQLQQVKQDLQNAYEEIASQKKTNELKNVSADEASGQVTALQEQLERMRKKHETKNKDVLELRDKIVEYKDLLEASKAEKVTLRNKLREEGRLANQVTDRVQQQVKVTDDLQKAITDANEQLLKLEQEHHQKMKEALSAKDAESETLRQRIAKLEGDLEAVGQDIIHMAQQSDTSGAHVQKLNQNLTAAEETITKLQDELSETKCTLEERCSELQTDNDALTGKEKEFATKIASLEKERTAAAATIAELEQGNVQLETEIGVVAKKYRQAQNDAKALNQLIDQTKKLFVSQKVELQRESAAIKDVLIQTQLQLKESEAERDTIKARSNNESATLRRNIELAEKESDSLRQQLADAKSELGSELRALQSNLTTVQQNLDNANGTISDLRSQVDELTLAKQKSGEGLRDVTAEKESLLGRCMTTEKKLNALAAKFNRLNQDLKDRTAALTELGEENSELQRTVNEMSSRTWQSGKGTKNCTECNNKFTQLTRKHHCRNCGLIYCQSCSSKTAKTSASKSKVRVCNKCYQDLAG